MLDAHTGNTVMSVPPQLSSQSIRSCAWSSFSQNMYILLSNSTLHVWQPVPQTDRMQLAAVWTEHRRNRLVTLCITSQDTIPPAQLRFWGLPPAQQEDEYLFAGTSDGDVWIMDRHAPARRRWMCKLQQVPTTISMQEHWITNYYILRPQAVQCPKHHL